MFPVQQSSDKKKYMLFYSAVCLMLISSVSSRYVSAVSKH